MGFENTTRAPLQVSARDFDLGRPDTTAPNVAQLADAVRQGYISASDIQARALQHPTLVAEAEAGPELVQAKLAAARAETAPGMLQAKAATATAIAQKAQAEAEVQQQMAALGETGRGHLAFLRSKGVIIDDMSQAGLSQKWQEYRNYETNVGAAKSAQEQLVKTRIDKFGGGEAVFNTSNGFPVEKGDVAGINAVAKQGSDWLMANPDYYSWAARGKSTFGAPGTVQAAPEAPAYLMTDSPPADSSAPRTGPSAPRTILPTGGQIIGSPAPVTAPAPRINPENFTPVSQVIPTPSPAPAAVPAPAPAPAPAPVKADPSQGVWDPVLGATVYPPPKERIPGEQVEKAGTAETAVNIALRMNEAYLDLVVHRRKMLGPIAGRAMELTLAKEWDEKVAIFQQTATALLAPVAKGIFNETGVLSDKDVTRYEGVFPSIRDTPGVGLKKLASITKTILTAYQKKADNWEAFGYTSGPMQETAATSRQEIDRIYKLYGMDFNGEADSGATLEAFQSGKVKVVNGVTYAIIPGPKGSTIYRSVDAATAKAFGGPQKPAAAPRKLEGEYIFPTAPGKLAAPVVEPRIAGNFQLK